MLTRSAVFGKHACLLRTVQYLNKLSTRDTVVRPNSLCPVKQLALVRAVGRDNGGEAEALPSLRVRSI